MGQKKKKTFDSSPFFTWMWHFCDLGDKDLLVPMCAMTTNLSQQDSKLEISIKVPSQLSDCGIIEEVVRDHDNKPVNWTGLSGNRLLKYSLSSSVWLSPLFSCMLSQSHTHSHMVTSHAFTHTHTQVLHGNDLLYLFNLQCNQNDWQRYRKAGRVLSGTLPMWLAAVTYSMCALTLAIYHRLFPTLSPTVQAEKNPWKKCCQSVVMIMLQLLELCNEAFPERLTAVHHVR